MMQLLNNEEKQMIVVSGGCTCIFYDENNIPQVRNVFANNRDACKQECCGDLESQNPGRCSWFYNGAGGDCPK